MKGSNSLEKAPIQYVKARECTCCRRELVERDEDDQPVERWNNRLRKWFTKNIEPTKFFMTMRRNFFTGGTRQVKVWACKCGNLTEEKD